MKPIFGAPQARALKTGLQNAPTQRQAGTFVEASGVISGIRFKRSVIENLDLNQEWAKRVCIIVQRLIEAKERRGELRMRSAQQGAA